MNSKHSKYVSKTIRTKWVREWGISFLSGLDELSESEDIKEFCSKKKLEYIEEVKTRSKKDDENSWMNSAARYMSQLRSAIMLWQQDRELNDCNSYPQKTKDSIVQQHLALLVMNFDPDFHKQRMVPTEEKKQEQRSNLVDIRDVESYLIVVEDLLLARQWGELAVGLIAATGRRAVEILKTACFEQAGQFEVKFSGQVKGQGQDTAYVTFTLVESYKVVDGLARLRRMPEIKELRKKTLAEIDSGRNSTINRLIKDKFAEILAPPTGEEYLSSKNLRASYAAASIYLFCPWRQEPSQFIKERLGHTSDATASNYQDYQVVNSEGKPLTRGVWVERLSEKMIETSQEMVHTSRMMVTKETRDTLYDQELLPYPDLASRLEELVRLAKIGKQFENGELVKEIEVVKTVTVEVPVRSDDAGRSEPQKSADIPVAKKSFEQLKQTRTTDGGLERVRRAVAAIKEYNLRCGGNKGDMWAINIRTLKDLTGVRTSTVENYFQADGQEELSIRFEANGNGKPRAIVGYNEMQGLGMHHNRGRGSARQVIKLA